MLITLTLLVMIGFAWRYASHRYKLPCPSWLGWLLELENPLARKFNAVNIVRQLEVRPGMKVLDAGCGPGRVAIPLAKAVGPNGEVVAADMQQEMLDRAKEKARAAGVTNICFLQLALGEGKLPINQFDRIVLVTVLGEIPDQKAAMRELFCALKTGGILSITETIFDPHYQRRPAVQELAGVIGFKEKSCISDRMGFILNLEKQGIGSGDGGQTHV